MTAANPAAVMAALQHSVFNEIITPSQVAGHAAAIAAAQAVVVANSVPGSDPVARAAAVDALNLALDAAGIEHGPEGGLVIPNLSPDIGLSPGFNAWMTFFGQFFDHGLDLVTKGGNGKVYIPLAADDPLIAGADGVFGNADDLPAHLRFMELTRATTAIDLNHDGDTLDPGETGNTQGQNTTTAFVDQNQTYTSHASHQVFLREYARVDADTVVATGKLLDGKAANGSLDGAIGNWAEVKAQALDMLGIALTDFDVGNVPWLRTDQYGKFIPGANGYAQVITGLGVDGKINTADDVVVEGTATGIDLEAVGALRTGHAFLNDIAHHAGPGFVDFNHDGIMNGPDVLQVADTDYLDYNRDGVVSQADVDAGVLAGDLVDADGNTVIDIEDLKDVNLDGSINAADLVANDRNQFTYDNEMLNSHFVTGDGRGNENIALTTVHSIFHSEHNRLVDVNKQTLIDNATTPQGIAFLNEWLLTDVTTLPTDLSTLNWDGERLFQAARFGTEMQYQHMVFEEFARRVQPMVDPFIFNNSPNVDPSIVAEFAHTVYRFGHSMLTDTVDRLDVDLTTLAADDVSQETLIAAFLNPQMYIASGATLEEANADIIRGLTRQLGNEIDEFVVPALQSNLLGLPLDLPALNIARGRETGVPSLNETRAQLYNDFGIVDLKPYESWSDFALAIKNPLSVVNFIAAYGTHASITSAATLEEKRAAAYELVTGIDLISNGIGTVPGDRAAFLNATGIYAAGAGERGGLDNVDLWIGGLAEKKNEFGGMLGSTFNFIFEYQMENLQNGDRLYYLTRTQGLNFLNNLEPNSFADMVMRNTELGDVYATHLSGQLFITPDHIIELDRGIAQEDYTPVDDPLTLFVDESVGIDPIWGPDVDPVIQGILGPKVARDYTGATTIVDDNGTPLDPLDDVTHDVGGYIRVQGGEHYVIGGTEGDDTIYSDSGIDTIWGDGGNDYINAGTESDDVFGGLGDDIIEDPFGDDVLRGNQGNDVITSARGADLLFGDEGKDYIILGQDASEVFGGEGDDFILGGNGKDFLLGNEGNDWIEGGGGFDTIAGENSELFFNSSIIGHDVLFNQGDEGDYDAESGDDIMGSGPSVFRYEGMFGFDWAIGKGDFSASGVDFDAAIAIFTTIPNDILKDRFDQVEAFSGWNFDDKLSGDDRGHKGGGSSAPDSVPTELFAEHLLTQEGINRINGFNVWFGGNADGTMDGTDARITLFGGASPVPGSTPVSTFRDGNILMGGDGSDLLRGRGGYDLLDGDAYLNVRIKIDINGTIYSAESMSSDTAFMGQYAGLVFNTDANGLPDFSSPAFGGRSLNSLLLDGTINPGQMSIVREILTETTPSDDTDTAIFQGTRAEYDIEGITVQVNLNGAAPDTISYIGTAQDLDGDGFISVRDRDTGAVGATIWQIDATGTAVQFTYSSRGLLTDDRDLLKNVEELQFADQLITIGGNNSPATGTVTISDATPYDGKVTPYVGQVLTATLSNLVDLDGVPLDSNGLPVGLQFEWQTTEFGSNSGWSTIVSNSGSYTVRSVDPGHVLRAVAVFKDADGNTERIISAETDNPTTAFSVNENSANGTVVGLQIPFSVDYDSQSIGGAPPVDVDLGTLFHAIDTNNDAGGRFTVVPNGVDFNGFPRFSIVVNNGGSQLLNYEAPVHTQGNQSHQFVDNQYQIVVNSYSDDPNAGGVLVAVRQFTILLNNVEPELVDIAPVLDLTGDATVTATTNFSENFGSTSYTDTDAGGPGAADDWTQDWIEDGDDGSSTSDNGQIRINGGALEFDNGNTLANSNGASITRAVDLTGASSATLSFSFNEQGFDAADNETVLVQFSATGAVADFVTVQTINSASGNGTSNIALTGPFTANSAIRFVVSAVNGGGDLVSIDNIVVARNVTTVTPGAAGIDYASTYTENGAAIAIASSPAVTDADNAFVMGATIKLTNAEAGDVLSIAGTLTGGIVASFGPPVAGQITMYLANPDGAVTTAAMQTAISQVRFGNPAEQNPVAGVRTIEVTVSDGEKESAIATATVTVVAVDDTPNANNDTIITNVALGTSFVVPEWVLLANDTDLDSVLDVTALSAINGLTASLLTNPGSVTVTDIGIADGAFIYTATGGALSDTANVTVDTIAALNTTTYSETFGGGGNAYTGNDGNWDDDWVESNDDNSSTGANGQIRVNNGQLQFDAGNNAGASDGASIQRTISDLAGATSATLSYAYTENIDVGESVLVEFSADGTTFTTVQNITSASNTGSITNFALTGPFTANATLRFTTSAMSLDADVVTIDNISVAFTTPAAVNGNGNANILIGDINGSEFDAGGGNDVILAGDGDDTITWNAGDGRDFVDGQANGLAGDHFIVNGDNSNTNPENFEIWSAAAYTPGGLRADTEIVVTRNGAIVAEIDNIEEITINSGGGNDTFAVHGSFAATSLFLQTFHINGGSGNNTVDISDLSSDHRIVFTSNGGDDSVIGTLRPQDIVDLDDWMVGTGKADVMYGGSGNDSMFGRGSSDKLKGGAGDDWVNGGNGKDTIIGGQGADRMSGGRGNDVFFFNDGHTGLGSARDVIVGFGDRSGNEDIISLRAIDANSNILGGGVHGQAFTFIGQGEFGAIGGGKGEVRYQKDGSGNTIVQLNVDNDDDADMEIVLVGFTGQLTADDFSL